MPNAESDTADFRTPGWDVGAADSCVDWAAWQHIAFAEHLLDGQVVVPMGEDAWNGRPPYRMYVALNDDKTADYGPCLAALTHAVLGIAKTRVTPPAEPGSSGAQS